jgi:hypothetical protein
MATAIVAALANVSDHPIGEQPPERATQPGTPAAAPPAQYDPFQPGLPPPPASRGVSFFAKAVAFLGNLCFFGFIVLVIAAFVLIQMGRAAQRRGRR